MVNYRTVNRKRSLCGSSQARLAIEEYVVTLRLKLHPVKSQLFETHHGANFLGAEGLKQGYCLYERLRQNEKHLFLQVRL